MISWSPSPAPPLPLRQPRLSLLHAGKDPAHPPCLIPFPICFTQLILHLLFNQASYRSSFIRWTRFSLKASWNSTV